MHCTILLLLVTIIAKCSTVMIQENDVNFRIDPGSKTCLFQRGEAGQVLELYYKVVDGQHGDLDISFDIIDPKAKKLLSDYKKSENSVIMELETSGDYAFCMDNTHSLINSKLVFLYVLIENKKETEIEDEEIEVAAEDDDGEEQIEKEILEWGGIDEDGQMYYLEVEFITNSLSRILKNVIKARHLLDIYSATKSRDSYVAFEDTFVVDLWSGLQISVMFVVGLLQVYMIKKLFMCPCDGYKNLY